MGCFSVSCGVSGISLYYDDAVLVPLIPAAYEYWHGSYSTENQDGAKTGFHFGGPHIVTNNGSCSLFYPFALPIYGNLDTYGQLEDIKEDLNTKTIEKVFGCTIEEFVHSLTFGEFSDDMIDKFPVLKYAACMYIHKDIYEHLSTFSINDCGNDVWSVYDGGPVDNDFLKLIGFEDNGKDDDRERYNQRWEHHDIADFVAWSDGMFCRFEYKGKQSQHGIYRPKDFFAYIKKEIGYEFDKKLIKSLKEMNAREFDYKSAVGRYLVMQAKREKIQKELDEHRKHYDDSAKYELEQLSLASSLESLKYDCQMRGTHDKFKMSLAHERISGSHPDWIVEIYGDVLGEDEFAKAVGKFQAVQLNMFFTNKLFMPTYNGPQCGNPDMVERLALKTAEITGAKVAERGSDD